MAQPSGQDAIAAAWSAERRLLNPAVRSDSETLQKLLAADFHEIGQSGKHWTRDEILNVLISNSFACSVATSTGSRSSV
ncbi:nuclear transport factor 2 family protein [Nesterenkonia sp. MY13]|uniref:Nuclear transport factor 2 family protein n=1 Tax=Nesterenkonia sedimenti TaxID=1463632 RepID=A0A7X8TI13_9MICC|nr:nuclear transport factor 2 family protein [Nesterenkonia sedimenti]